MSITDLTHVVLISDNINAINMQDSAILMQKYIRRYLQQKNILIPSSKYQTKKWRQKRCWYSSGKSNECEKYQIGIIGCHWVKTF